MWIAEKDVGDTEVILRAFSAEAKAVKMVR